MSTTTNILDLVGAHPNGRPREPFPAAKAWTRQSLAESDWTLSVGDAVKKELADVVAQLRRQKLPIPMLDPAYFQLGASLSLMGMAKRMVHDGHGFAILDGFDLDDWSEEENKAVYWLLGKLLSRPVAQDAKGMLFRHIRYMGEDEKGGADRSLTTKRLAYHNDNSGNRDVPQYQSLLCLHAAEEGGVSEYCSMYSLYNAMAKEAPVELERLFQPFFHNRLGIQADRQAVAIRAPALAWDGNKLFGRYSINKITGGYREAGLPMDNESLAALECVISIIPARQLSAQYMLRRGQMVIINNREGLHQRREYKDGAVAEQKRHLMRLWLRDRGRRQFDG